ncbi:PH domain-containing protein [Paraburkholderia denitrificans]|uniref:PH domain-containing protein n=1 Tax=Paraburkholderia denitrificans TaxID=694025 RepID=A0ABW0J9H3_9BURK
MNHLPKVLSDGEQVLAFSSGIMDANTWLITLTDRRIIFLDKGMIYGLRQAAIDLDKINAVSGETGLLFGKIAIEDAASQRMITNVLKKSVIAFTNKVRDAIEARKQSLRSVTASAQPASDDIVVKLERLAALLEKGILTQEEFVQQKARLLD